MARIVVSGGAGFVGSHVCDQLIARGDEVVCVDNLITGSEQNVAHLVDHPQFRLLVSDVASLQVKAEVVSSLSGANAGIDAVMHLASPASPTDFSRIPIEILQVGSMGTQNMLELAEQSSAKFFLASTSEVYGDPAVHPQPESYWGNVNPIGPRSVYDEAKRYAEALTTAFHRHRNVDIRIIRIFNTYGPRMRPDDGRVVSNFVTQALQNLPITVYGDGSQTRSFCYVDDQVEGHLALLDSQVTSPVNIGSNSEFTMLELAKVVLQATESKSELCFEPLPQDDPSRRQPDLNEAATKLNWKPQTELADGIAKTVDYFRQELKK